ncbi:MAG: DUF2226 domain-containing protein [Methanomicrobia archaeon]|nr:DUF2226 domain-containing protein [Methanomicrobia archaeon]
MELPRGTTTKYYEKENLAVDNEVLKDITSDFVGYIRIFGKNNNNIEDNYLLIENGRIVAAESEINTSKRFQGGESLTLMKERVYNHAAIEFVKYDDFRYQMALEINEDCRVDGKTVPKMQMEEKIETETIKKAPVRVETIIKEVPAKKLDREELLKKYKIKIPADETIVQLIGEKDEKLVKFEDRLKPELLNEIRSFFYSKTLFMEASFTGFEIFLRGDVLNCNIDILLKCFVHKKDIKMVEKIFEREIERIIREILEKEVGTTYKLNIILKSKFRIREASRFLLEEYSTKDAEK